MPILGNDEEQIHVGSFGYSAVRMDTLEESMYTLATIAIDMSGSVAGYRDDMVKVLKAAVAAIGNPRLNPRADNVLLRVISFNNQMNEIHGFRPVNTITDMSIYDSLKASGMTALFDAVISCCESTMDMSARLHQNRFTANGIFMVITDGVNNDGRYRHDSDIAKVEEAFKNATKSEQIESLDTFLIGVGVQDQRVKQSLTDLHSAGFTRPFVELKDANEQTITKLGLAISESISSSSQALGTGGPSQAISQNLTF